MSKKSKRYCTICKDYKIYKYDHMMFHSFCTECGRSSLFSRKYSPEDTIKK